MGVPLMTRSRTASGRRDGADVGAGTRENRPLQRRAAPLLQGMRDSVAAGAMPVAAWFQGLAGNEDAAPGHDGPDGLAVTPRQRVRWSAQPCRPRAPTPTAR